MHMSGKRRIAYGIGNWPELVRDGQYFYVDHTAFIRELEKCRTPVFLRPRVTAADRRQVAAYAKDVRLLHPTKAVEAYVCSIVGRHSYAFARVKTDSI